MSDLEFNVDVDKELAVEQGECVKSKVELLVSEDTLETFFP